MKMREFMESKGFDEDIRNEYESANELDLDAEVVVIRAYSPILLEEVESAYYENGFFEAADDGLRFNWGEDIGRFLK